FTAQDLLGQLRSLESIYLAIDELAQLGKPIHISEFQIPLPAVIDAFDVSISEAEEIQAEIARIFYKVFFSHPAVEVITYWNFYRAWQSGSGFLRDDLSIKPIFDELKKLIHEEWKTTVRLETDISGKVAFNGFAGRYEVSVESGAMSETFIIDVKKGEKNEFTLALGQ
ncbi:MAG: glycoside hydrolase, partial [Kosmotogaceae bacterium]|nr:glycoside hydrolase [Kosmotogaceae bacterium]